MLADLVYTTVDLNLPELGYVADHLQPDECRQLIAALHSKEYDISPNLDLKVRKVPRDVTCLKMLLHWNSSPGEGLGQTHELLYRRLSQLNHKELADWLSKTVFHQLSLDLDRSLLQNPFKEGETTPNVSKSATEQPKQKESETEGWTPFDTICCTIIILLTCCILILVIQGLWDYTCEVLRKRRDKKTSGLKSKRRNPQHNQNYTSSEAPPITVAPKSASTTPPQQKPVNI